MHGHGAVAYGARLNSLAEVAPDSVVSPESIGTLLTSRPIPVASVCAELEGLALECRGFMPRKETPEVRMALEGCPCQDRVEQVAHQ